MTVPVKLKDSAAPSELQTFTSTEENYLAYQAGMRSMTTEDFNTVISRTYPLAVTMQEQISELRAFAHNRAQPADGDSLVWGISDLPPKQDRPEEINPFDGDED